MRAQRKLKALGGFVTIALLASGFATAATAEPQADGVTGTDGVQEGNGVPEAFSVTHSSWTSSDAGYVVGFAPCGGNEFCEHLLSTDDAGQTWTEQPLPDFGANHQVIDLLAAESNGKSTRLLSVGDGEGSIIGVYSSYDGEAWQREDLGGDGGAYALDMATIGDSVYVYGDAGNQEGSIFRAPIGEDRWEQASELPQPSGYGPYLAGNGDSGMAWTTDPQSAEPLATTVDGSTWTARENLPCRNDRDALIWGAVGSAEAMYVVCDRQMSKTSRVFVSSDAGESFSEVGPLELPDKYHDETWVGASGDTIAVAYRGSDDGGDGYGGGCSIQSSFDGGRTWERTLSEAGEDLELTELEFTDARHGTATCGAYWAPGAHGSDVYRTTDGGKTWEPLGLGSDGADPSWIDPAASSWTSADTGYVLGWTPCDAQAYCSTIVGTTDGGQTWAERPAPKLQWIDEYDKRVGMFFTSKADPAFGLVYAPEESFREKTAFASYDGGETWQAEDFGLGDTDYWWVEDVTATDSYVYAMVNLGASGDDYTSTLFRTPIGEDQWERVDQVTNNGMGSAVDARGDTGVAFAEGNDTVPGTLWTTGDGEEWTKHGRACALPRQTQQYRANGAGQIYAFCGHYEGTKRKLFVSDDGGDTFSAVGGAPVPDGVTDSAAAGDSLLVAGESSATGCAVSSSTDGGESWTGNELKAGDLDPFGEAVGLDFQLADDRTGTVLCASTAVVGGGVLYRTTDGGRTWEPIDLTNAS